MKLQADRIRQHSPRHVNERITDETLERIRAFSGTPAAIERRLQELDQEWDMERALFALTSVNMLLGLSASARNPRWLVWPAMVAAFQLQHAIHRWCPPVSMLRRFGIRTRPEIDGERAALKAMRGDFQASEAGQPPLAPEQAFAAALR